MDERHALGEWMNRRGYTNRTLADALGLSYVLVYKVTAGDKRISNGFKCRFAQRFGWDEAVAVFGPDLPSPESEGRVKAT